MWALVPSPAVWVVTFILLGIGNGAVASVQTAIALEWANNDSAALPALLSARLFGGAFAIASGGACFVSVATLKLSWQGIDPSIARDALAYLTTLAGLADGSFRTGVVGGYTFGFLGVFQVYLGIGGVALLVSFLIRPSNGTAKSTKSVT